MRYALLKAYAALLATVLFWGLSFTVTKVALLGFSPPAVAFLRFTLAALILLPAALATNALRLSLARHARVFGIAILFPGCYFALETWALRLTTATSASLIAAAVPMAVLALASILARRLPTAGQALGVFSSLAGVGLLVGFSAGPANSGDALMAGAVVCAAVYMVAASRLEGVSPLGFTALQMCWGALFFLPFFAADMPSWSEVPGQSLAAVVALALFATVGAFLAYNYALTKVSATTASMCINAVPLVGVAGAHLVLDESITAMQALGGAVILVCVWATAPRGERE
ncbi:DMT family transporter [Fundidesulfovibrio butyratiphilus]